MKDERAVVKTALSVSDCADVFRGRATQPLLGKGLVGRFMKSGQKQRFFEPTRETPTAGEQPELSLGSLFTFALDVQVAIHMYVWDREGTRTVELIVPYQAGDRGGADRMIGKFTAALQAADPRAEVAFD